MKPFGRLVTILSPVYERFDWLVIGLVSFLLLVPKFQFISISGTYINVRIEDFVVALVYGLWLLGWLGGRYSLRSVFNYRPIIGFLVYGGFVTLLGVILLKSVDAPHLGLLHWARRVEYVGIYFVAATTLQRKRILEYIYLLIAVGVVAWIYGFLQWRDVLPGVHTLSKSGEVGTFSDLGYVISTFAAHYDFGAFLIFMMMLSLWGYFSHKDWTRRLIFLLLAFAVWWMARLVYGRAAYLGMMVATTFFLIVKLSPWILLPLYELFRTFDGYFGGRFSMYTYDFKLEILPEPPAPPPVVVATPTPLLDAEGEPEESIGKIAEETQQLPQPSPLERSWLDERVNEWSLNLRSVFGRIDLNLDPSANIRLKEWPDALARLGYNFLWGNGYSSVGIGTDNDYVRHLVEVGVIGLSIFLLILFDFVKLMWRTYRQSTNAYVRHFHLAVIGFVIGLLVEAVFIDIFASSKIAFLMWFLFGMVVISGQNDIPLRFKTQEYNTT